MSDCSRREDGGCEVQLATLFEPEGVKVRVQTGSTDQPFDINEGSKLELGSTAGFRC